MWTLRSPEPRFFVLFSAALPVLLAALLAGCGAGQYGYARRYVPLDAEEQYINDAERVPYENVRRDPDDYRSVLLGWFGTVTGLEKDPGSGKTLVHMDFRTHQRRHLCESERDSSCRVTVSESAGGPFTARLEIREQDRRGQDRLWKGSLVKVYGRPTGDFDARGGPVLDTEWYRHWPHGTYVTTASRSSMRK